MDDNEDGGRAAGGEVASGPVMGPSYLFWETSLERLKLLNYEMDYCVSRRKKEFNRVHFVFPTSNQSTQFDEFMDLCEWLCLEISRDPKLFKRDQFDDPNTACNKLMLALRQLDCRLNFPAQKLRTPHGETVCSVLDFLTEKCVLTKGIKFEQPIYPTADSAELAQADEDADLGDIPDETGADVADDAVFQEPQSELMETSLDQSAHQILHAVVDPVEWKMELERVGPRLRAQQQLTANEWRAHVDSTVQNKGLIEKVMSETQGDLQAVNRDITDELNKLRSKERYSNNQYASLCQDFKDVRQQLEELESRAGGNNEKMARLTAELSELSERLDDLKESLESKDSGINDTSPMVRIKAALQQIKSEIHGFDLRIGVVSHSLLAARVSSTSRRRDGAAQNARRRMKKNRRKGEAADNSSDEVSIDEY